MYFYAILLRSQRSKTLQLDLHSLSWRVRETRLTRRTWNLENFFAHCAIRERNEVSALFPAHHNGISHTVTHFYRNTPSERRFLSSSQVKSERCKNFYSDCLENIYYCFNSVTFYLVQTKNSGFIYKFIILYKFI